MHFELANDLDDSDFRALDLESQEALIELAAEWSARNEAELFDLAPFELEGEWHALMLPPPLPYTYTATLSFKDIR